MSLMRRTFEQVRVSGKIELRSRVVRDSLPIVYTGDNPTGETYFNSGGRSVLIDRPDGVFKITGVDPHGHLSKKVAASENNTLVDVVNAAKAFDDNQNGGNRYRGKPFGVLTEQNVQRAELAFDRLNGAYRRLGIKPPCDILSHKGLGLRVAEEDAYQVLFDLPNAESDLRVHEFSELLKKKMAKAPRSEFQRKLNAVGRLYGRFAAWAGVAAGIMMSEGLLPTWASWHPQNFVISNVFGGYGIFRVDHTSTEHIGSEEATKMIMAFIERQGQSIQTGPWLDEFAFEFSIIPEAFQIAALFPEFTDQLPVSKDLSPFERLFKYYSDGRRPSIANLAPLLTAHFNGFGSGAVLYAKGDVHGLEIPDELFREVLE